MLLRPFEPAREKTVAGWLRIVFFASILFNHAVIPSWEFVDERMWVVWAQTLRDFGAVGFFIVAGVSLRGKVLATGGRVTLPANLLKLTIAAASLAAFDMLFDIAKGSTPGSVGEHFYKALYDTNLWFFVAYAFAGPLLLSLDRKGIFWTGLCCLGFVMFPAHTPLLSPFILQTISLAFVAMAIGMELHGKQANAGLAFALAALAFVVRVWLDDHGVPVYPAVDIALRLVYGVASFLVLKWLADRLCRRLPPPGWANYLFVPYVVQFPLIVVVTVLATAVCTASLRVNMPPIFFSFWDWLGFRLAIFGVALALSFALAWLLRRYRIRV